MSLGNITLYSAGPFSEAGTKRFTVASGTTASINPGEPVTKALGNGSGNVVVTMTTNKPVAGTDFVAGVSQSASTETVSLVGTVDVYNVYGPDSTFLCNPTVAATWNTQAKYDALVGARVLFDLTAGVYTVLATDGATNGLVVEPLNILKYPGKVRFSFRKATNYLA